MLGFSGARITNLHVIVKECDGAYKQAEWCKTLGQDVCPKILSVSDNYYIMERLFDPPEFPTLLEIKGILRDKVWNRPFYAGLFWRMNFLTWAQEKNHLELIPVFEGLYPDGGAVEGCLIHGDCTLANVMLNEVGDIRLIDPLRPEGKMPPLREVDMGKLLQSAIGWEDLLRYGTPLDIGGIWKSKLLDDEDTPMTVKCLFWLQVQLLRILPYAEKNNRPEVTAALMEAVNALRVRP